MKVYLGRISRIALKLLIYYRRLLEDPLLLFIGFYLPPLRIQRLNIWAVVTFAYKDLSAVMLLVDLIFLSPHLFLKSFMYMFTTLTGHLATLVTY